MKLLLSIIGITFCTLLSAQNYQDTLDIRLEKLYQQKHLPGFVVSVVNEDGFLYKNSFGFANLEDKTPYTQKTVQIMASVTKTVGAFAVMKLVEDGKLTLETPINDILPFKVINPHFPETAITINHLVTHTAGILDKNRNYDFVCRSMNEKNYVAPKPLKKEGFSKFVKKWQAAEALSLSDFCKKALSTEGEWNKKKFFTKMPAGSSYEYSNLGTTLLGYIVELAAKKSYQDYTKEILFDKLGLKNTSWTYQTVNKGQLAMKYVLPEKFPMHHYTEVTFPDGGLYMSCEDLSIYLMEMIKGYNGKSDLLKPESYKKMFTGQLTEEQIGDNKTKNHADMGVFWHISPKGLIWHNGGDVTGSVVYMWFDPSNNIGRIMMTNYFVNERPSQVEFIYAWRTLEKYGVLLEK